MKTVWRQLLNIVAVVVTIAVNGAANIVRFNGQTTGQISDQYPTYFAPAGYTFSIWGVIYLALLAFAVYQALPAQRTNALIARITPWFVASCALNCVWLVLWHYEQFPLTLLVIVALLVCLIAIYALLRRDPAAGRGAVRWFVGVPFSIYLGWITVATIANAAVLLRSLAWNGWGIAPQLWSVLLIVVAITLTAWIGLRYRDVAYVLVPVWAFGGIIVAQRETRSVVVVAALGIIVMLAALGLGWLRHNRTGSTGRRMPAPTVS